MYYTAALIVIDSMLIKCTCMGYVYTYLFLWIMLATGFGDVLVITTCAFIKYGSALIISVCAPLEMTLYTKQEVQVAMDGLKQVGGYIEVWKMEDFLEDVSVEDVEGQAYQSCRNLKAEIDPEAPKVKLYTELKDEQIPGSKLTGQVMARLISFLKQHGHYTAVQTQDLGNYMYAAILRGTQMKREVASMLLRRFIVKKITQFPAFFSKYLRRSLAHTYGHARRDPAEVDRLEKEGKITADDAADERLPGPFSLVTFCQHLLKDRTWGDQHVLAILSCLWQIRITVLHAEDLTVTRIRHDLPLPKTDLLLLFTGGNHFMGAGECFLVYGLIIYDHGMIITACGVIESAHAAIDI